MCTTFKASLVHLKERYKEKLVSQRSFIAHIHPVSFLHSRPAQLARVLSRSPLMATAFPAKIAAVGTVKVAPEEAVRT